MSGLNRRRHCLDRGNLPPVLPLIVAALLCFGFFRSVSVRLFPAVKEEAAERAVSVIGSEIVTAVEDCLRAEAMEYSDFIALNTDGNGALLALSIRPAESGRFRQLAADRVSAALGALSPDALGIPLGDLSDSVLLAGIGPRIQVRVRSVEAVEAAYSSSFTEVGTGQTRHRVCLDVTATVHLLISWKIISVTVTEQVCVAESVIFGTLPNT